MQTQKLTSPQPEPPPAVHGANLYFLCVADEHERQIAQAWLEAKYPGSVVKLVSELKIDRLTQDHTLTALVRKGKGGRPPTAAWQNVRNEHRIYELQRLEPEDLAKEVVECAPVRCADHWREDGSEGGDGELSIAGFLEQFGKTCAPACIKWRSDSRVLKLMWA
jgi:hypothetical protein